MEAILAVNGRICRYLKQKLNATTREVKAYLREHSKTRKAPCGAFLQFGHIRLLI